MLCVVSLSKTLYPLLSTGSNQETSQHDPDNNFTHFFFEWSEERSGSVAECLTRDQRAVGSSLTGDTALWSLSKTHLS